MKRMWEIQIQVTDARLTVRKQSNRTEICKLARDVVLFPGPICAMFLSFQPSVTALVLS